MDTQEEQSQPLPTQPATPMPSPSNGKPWVKWVIALVAVALLSSAATYLAVSQTKTQQQEMQATTIAKPTPTIETVNQATASATANWLTYINASLEFSLNYPSDLKVRDAFTTEKAIYIEPTQTTPIGQNRYYMWIQEFKNPNHLPIKDVITEGILDNQLKQQVQFGKVSLGQYIVYTTYDMPSQSGSVCKYITSDESRYIALCMSPYNPNAASQDQAVAAEQQEHLETYNQILSTFRFE